MTSFGIVDDFIFLFGSMSSRDMEQFGDEVERYYHASVRKIIFLTTKILPNIHKYV